MNKLKIFNYELKQIIFSKKYFYINLILILYGFNKLNSNLSPYNPVGIMTKWSYSDFVAGCNSFLIIFTVLLCIAVFSKNEEKVKNIIFSTKFSEKGYFFIKQISIFAAISISLLILVIGSFIWYGYYLNFYSYHQFLYPIFIFAFPSIIFIMGISMNIGRCSEKALYLLVPVLLIGTSLNLRLPCWVDIAGNNTIFILNSFTVRGAENFILPMDFICSRLIMIGIGIILCIFACRRDRA